MEENNFVTEMLKDYSGPVSMETARGLKRLLDEAKRARDEALSERDELKTAYHDRVRKANTAEWERDEAQGVARRYFRWITDAECPDPEYTDRELASYPWLANTT